MSQTMPGLKYSTLSSCQYQADCSNLECNDGYATSGLSAVCSGPV